MKIDDDNGDGTVSDSLNNNNSFYDMKVEHIAADVPASGFVIDNVNGINNQWYNPRFSHQGFCVFRWIRNNSFNNVFYRPVMTGGITPSLIDDPDRPGNPLSLFVCISFGGLQVEYNRDNFSIEEQLNLAQDGNGNLIGVGDTRFSWRSTNFDNVATINMKTNQNWKHTYGTATGEPRVGIGTSKIGFSHSTSEGVNGDVVELDAFASNDLMRMKATNPTPNAGFKVNNGTWDKEKLWLGSYCLWVDASGNLRIKQFAPTSDTSGTIVGTQS